MGSMSVSAQLADNQRPIGTYLTDQLPEYGTGDPEIPGTYTVLTGVPTQNLLKIGNAKLVGMRFGLNNPIGATTVHVRPFDGQIYLDILTQKVESTEAGWNYVMFDDPIDYDYIKEATALLVGYDYTQIDDVEEGYPLCVNEEINPLGLVYIGQIPGTDRVETYDFSGTGSLCVQFIVEGDIPQYDIIMSDYILDKCAMKIGEKTDVMVTAYNFGTVETPTVNFDVLIDDQKVGSVSKKVGPIGKPYILSPVIPADLTPGIHKLALRAASVGSTPITDNTEDDKVSLNFTAITDDDIVPRDKVIIEQMTSVDCQWCPRGTALLEKYHNEVPEVSAVALHGHMGNKDPYATDESLAIIQKLGASFFPVCALNRIPFIEGYCLNLSQEEADYDKFIAKCMRFLSESSEVCIAPLTTKAILSEDGESIHVTVEGRNNEHLVDILEDCVVNIYIVENGLVSRQKQPDGGYISEDVHNNVFRKLVTKLDGDALSFDAGDHFLNDYDVAMHPDWVAENLEVVAFVTRKTDFYYGTGIINANREKVQTSSEGIDSVLSSTTATAPIYDLSGRTMQPTTKGIGIQGGKKVIR